MARLEQHQDHVPVMIEEVMQYLDLNSNKTYVDCTFGAGGYSDYILSKTNSKLIAIDQDPNVQVHVDRLKKEYGSRFSFIKANFSEIAELLNDKKVDGIVLDLGVSSMQLDQSNRGFSFSKDAKLDMRMSCAGRSAYDVVNELPEAELADIIYNYGDERSSRKIAKAIVLARTIAPIESTTELANIIRAVLKTRGKIDAATKTFQAIRIYVNDELGALERFLSDVDNCLNDNARLVVATFHSLEDKIIKQYLKSKSLKKVARSKYAKPVYDSEAIYQLITNKAVKPSQQEIKINPRARSAKVRAASKLPKQKGEVNYVGE